MLISTQVFAQQKQTTKQALDKLLVMYDKGYPKVNSIHTLMGGKPTDKLTFSAVELPDLSFPGYGKFGLYFVHSGGSDKYGSLMVSLSQLSAPYKSAKVYLAPNATVWDVIVKNGMPKLFELRKKNSHWIYPEARLTFTYHAEAFKFGNDSFHDFLSVSLTADEVEKLSEHAFLFTGKPLTEAQKEMIKPFLQKIRVEFVEFSAPYIESDDSLPELIELKEN